MLKGADAVVFVADSQREMREQNIESFQNMRENLIENNIDPDDIPLILQYNKRDLLNILSIEEFNNDLNHRGYPYIEATAINGTGVKETFQAVTKLLIKNLSKKYSIELKDEESAEMPSQQSTVMPVEGKIDSESHNLSERLENLYNELKKLNDRIERMERLIIENKEQKERPLEHIETQLLQIQKTLSDMSKSHRELIIQLRTVYDILSKARLEKKGIFF